MPPLEVLDAPFERLEAIDAVWRAVENLNVDLKMALLLRDIVGLSYTEIADSLEITLATVKWRIYKAREEVQLALAREGIHLYGDEAARAGPGRRPAARLARVARQPGGEVLRLLLRRRAVRHRRHARDGRGRRLRAAAARRDRGADAAADRADRNRRERDRRAHAARRSRARARSPSRAATGASGSASVGASGERGRELLRDRGGRGRAPARLGVEAAHDDRRERRRCTGGRLRSSSRPRGRASDDGARGGCPVSSS